MIWKLTFGILISNFIFFYIYSIGEFLSKIFEFKVSKLNKIIFGYSIFLIILYFLYFILNLEVKEIYLFVIITFIFFLTKINRFLNNFFLLEKIS